MNSLVRAVFADITRNFASLFVGAVISAIITVVWSGNLVTIILASIISALVGGFVLFVFLGQHEWSKNVFLAFVSASLSAHVLSFVVTFTLYYIEADTPFNDPKIDFLLKNSFYSHLKVESLIIPLGYFAMIWLYEYCRKKQFCT
ncbi:TPA: hypothetical protein ACVU4V_004644 [Vibrio parahaemolyticus]